MRARRTTPTLLTSILSMWESRAGKYARRPRVRNLTNREHLGLARTFDLDNHAAETLHALFVTLDDFVGYGDRVTGLEHGTSASVFAHICSLTSLMIASLFIVATI